MILDSPCRFELQKLLGVPLFSGSTAFDRVPSVHSWHTAYQRLSSPLFHLQSSCPPCVLAVETFIRFISDGARCLESWIYKLFVRTKHAKKKYTNFKINSKNSCRPTGMSDWNKPTFIFLKNVSDTFLSLPACGASSLKLLKWVMW